MVGYLRWYDDVNGHGILVMEWVSVLPQLSVGALGLLVFGYITIRNGETNERQVNGFLGALDERTKRHENAMKEREDALRSVEREVRTEISKQLAASHATNERAAAIMERVIKYLDKD